MTQLHIRLEHCFECFKWIMFSSVHLQSFCAFLSRREYERLTENEAASQFSQSVLLACYNRIQWKGEHLGRWSSKQAGSERRCPHVQLGLTKKHSLFSFLPCPLHFYLLPLYFSLLGSAPPFGAWLEFRMGLHLPGRLGWWSPLPQGLGRPPGLLLEETICRKINKSGMF